MQEAQEQVPRKTATETQEKPLEQWLKEMEGYHERNLQQVRRALEILNSSTLAREVVSILRNFPA